MSSLIEGYNYDIFISYRQKDNKHDGWVTEFVNNLKGELESTFKEEISVYFDINLHDGLLETHDVEASLKEKLKCLIFIPIISRTYCDPKSFAWEHEFRAFLEMASKDQFGLKVKLPNGNVASRVLPVRIHDLDVEDKKTIEEELGGYIRGIEFIYKEPGVDRPLKQEDKEEKNLSGTKYNNQINKVANSIREIIHGLRGDYNQTNQITQSGIIKSKGGIRILLGLLFFVIIVATAVFMIFIKPSLHTNPTKDLTALHFYERGKDYYSRFLLNHNEIQLNMADTFYRKAIKRDSLFAESYVGLASVFISKSSFSDIYKSDYLDSVLILCNHAISLKRNISDAYIFLGEAYEYLNDFNKSEEQYKLALKYSSGDALAYCHLGSLYIDTDPLNSIIHLEKARSIDDGSYQQLILSSLRAAYNSVGFSDKAEEIISESFKLDNNYVRYMYRLATNEYVKGNYIESLNYGKKAYERDSSHNYLFWMAYMNFLNKDFPNALIYLEKLIPDINKIYNVDDLFIFHRIAYCYNQIGLTEKGSLYLNKMMTDLKKLDVLDRYTGGRKRIDYDLAVAYAVVGDIERELLYLKSFSDQKYIGVEWLNLLKNDPVFDHIKNNDEYKKIVTSIESKYQIEHERVREWLEENNML